MGGRQDQLPAPTNDGAHAQLIIIMVDNNTSPEAQSQKSDGMFDRRYTKPTIVYCNHASERQCTCHEAVMKHLTVLRQLYTELATRTKLLEELHCACSNQTESSPLSAEKTLAGLDRCHAPGDGSFDDVTSLSDLGYDLV